MRILWFFEKISSHEIFFKDNKEEKLKIIFEQLVDFLVISDKNDKISQQ